MNTVTPSKSANKSSEPVQDTEAGSKLPANREVKLYSVQTVITEFPNGVTKRVTTTKLIEKEINEPKVQTRVTDFGFSATTSSAKRSVKRSKLMNVEPFPSNFNLTDVTEADLIAHNDAEKSDLARFVYQSDIRFLHLEDTSGLKSEPIYVPFGGSEMVFTTIIRGAQVPTSLVSCAECGLHSCDEYKYGDYCVAAVKRYYETNTVNCTLKGAYVIFEAFYNRIKEVKNFELTKEIPAPPVIYRTPRCMKEGSLRFALQWCKYHMERNEYYCFLHNKKAVKMVEDIEDSSEEDKVVEDV